MERVTLEGFVSGGRSVGSRGIGWGFRIREGVGVRVGSRGNGLSL